MSNGINKMAPRLLIRVYNRLSNKYKFRKFRLSFGSNLSLINTQPGMDCVFGSDVSIVNSLVGDQVKLGNKVRMENCQISSGLITESGVKVNKSSFDTGVYIYRDSCIDNSKLCEKSIVYPSAFVDEVQLGDFSYIGQGSRISKTSVGKFCSMGPNLICGWGVHPVKGISSHPMFYSSKSTNRFTFATQDKIEERKYISIGNDVFIGINVIILDGVNIGDGAVIGAGAVVSKDIPPYAIAVGCPIKVIGYRFSEEIIAKLLKMKWWNWEFEKLREVEKSFFNIDEFIDKYGKA